MKKRIEELEALLKFADARINVLVDELCEEAKRTAEEKLRADQMTQQHAMQAKMHAQASEQLAAVQQGVERSATYGMNLGQRIQHVGGRENAQTYIEFGSVDAVRMLVAQVLRDLPSGYPDFCSPSTHPTQQGLADDGLYYLQDARWSAMVGNCPSFWRKGGGYTTNLDEAERFTFEAAMKQNSCRETDLPWLCAEVDKLRRPTVDCQYMPRSWDDQRAALAAQAKQGEQA